MENEILENSNQNESVFEGVLNQESANEFDEVASHENTKGFEEVANQESANENGFEMEEIIVGGETEGQNQLTENLVVEEPNSYETLEGQTLVSAETGECEQKLETIQNIQENSEKTGEENTEELSQAQEQKIEHFERDELFDDEKFCTNGDNGILEKNNLEETQEIKQETENLTENTKLVSEFDDIKCDDKVGVYIKVNDAGFITDVSSDLFLDNLDGWIKIDEGEGDRFVHAQSSYFDSPLVDEFGNYLLKR